jgi:hypothetical protein
MTKKHFEALAVALAYQRPQPTWCANKRAQFALDVAAVADVCAASSPRFDRERFVDACQTYQVAIRDGKLIRVRS